MGGWEGIETNTEGGREGLVKNEIHTDTPHSPALFPALSLTLSLSLSLALSVTR